MIETYSYQTLVEDQITRHKAHYDPFDCGINFLKDDWNEIPLWSLPFSQKPLPPNSEDIFSLLIVDNNTLDDLDISRKYSAVEIEREILTNSAGDEVLIERVYCVVKSNFKRDLQYFSVLLNNTTINSGEADLVVEIPNVAGLNIYRLKINNIRETLQFPKPLILRTAFE